MQDTYKHCSKPEVSRCVVRARVYLELDSKGGDPPVLFQPIPHVSLVSTCVTTDWGEGSV